MKTAMSFIGAVLMAITSFAQMHSYYFNGNFNEHSGAGPALTEILSCGAGAGSFIAQSVFVNNNGYCGDKKIFAFQSGGGVVYPNPSGFIGATYTIHIFFKFDSISPNYQRIIDFQNSTLDFGMYSYQSCLNFYPNGPVGTCPNLYADTFYLLSIVRTAATQQMTVYFNGDSVGGYIDNLNIYAPSSATTPIILFKDDSSPFSVPCENMSGAIKYFALSPTTSTPAQIHNVWDSICTIISLPLQDMHLNGTTNGKTVKLSWQNASQANTAYFNVQHSVNGLSFYTLGKVHAFIQSAEEPLSYGFTHSDPANGANYYRLQIVAKDGATSYSRILNLNTDLKDNFHFYPNPVNDRLFVTIGKNKAEIVTLEITDLQGRIFRKEITKVEPGLNTFSVNTDDLPQGNYMLTCKGKETIQKLFTRQ